MTRRPSRPRSAPPELPMDVGEAAGLFGLLAGGLSVVVPYFLGLVVGLAILGAAVGVTRLVGSPRMPRVPPWAAGSAIGALLAGFAVYLLLPAPTSRLRGLLLAVSVLPLWWIIRRARPFGGT